MTSPQDPNQTEPDLLAEQPEVVGPAELPTPSSPQAPPQPRQRRPRASANPAIDPRLVQLERRARRPSRAGDASLLVIAGAALIFGIFIHFWAASSLLDAFESDDGPVAVEATSTPSSGGASGTGVTVTPTTIAQPTATPLPDRTSCEEIRGTQYRSVSEREFFLANCTS